LSSHQLPGGSRIAAFNWLKGLRSLREIQQPFEQEETRALRSAPSKQGDNVSDRMSRWFESNLESQKRAPLLGGVFFWLFASALSPTSPA